MPPTSNNPVDQQLRQRRDDIRRSLARVNTAGIAVVLVTIALAVAAAVAAMRAGRQTQLAREANERGRQELWKSYLAQAHAGRLSRVVGSKASGLEAIAAAAAIRPSLELRNEAIAHLAMLDFEPTPAAWTNNLRLDHRMVDPRLEWFFESDGRGSVRLSRIGDPTNAHVLRSTNGVVWRGSFSADGRWLAVTHSTRRVVVWNLESREAAYSRDGVTLARFSDHQNLLVALGEDSVRVLEGDSGRELGLVKPGGKPSEGILDPTGDRLALAVQSKVQVWDWRRGVARETNEMEGSVWAIAWHGDLLAASDGAGEVRVWDRMTKRSRRMQAHQNVVNRLFFDPRGEVLVSGSYDGSTKIWNPRSGQLLLTTSDGFLTQFSPDGARVVFQTQSGWRIWRVSKPVGLAALDCSSGSSPNVWHTDFSRDGRWLSATKNDGVGIFDLQSGQRVLFERMNQSRAAFFLPDGTNLLTTSTRRIGYWPIDTNSVSGGRGFRLGERQLLPLTNFTYLEPGELSFDRRQLIVPLSQTELGLFDLGERREVRRFTNAILPKLSSISPDGRLVAMGTFHGRGLALWEVETGRMLRDFRDGNCSAHFGPDGRYLVSAGSGAYRVHETTNWNVLHRIPTDSGTDLPSFAAFSSDSRLVAVIKQLNRVELFETDTWQPVAALSPPDPQLVNWISFNPGSQLLAVATRGDIIQMWNLAAIRERLDSLGLDWAAGGSGRPTSSGTTKAVAAEVAGGAWSPHLLVPVVVGVLVVLACAMFIRQRQRRLLAAYMEVDQLAEQQKLQLDAAQAEIIHSQKMKALGTLAAGIAHDFNNLLSVIRMSNQLTGESAKGNSDIEENVAEVEQAVQQGKKLVRSMLGYSRDDENESGPFALPELVEDTVALLSKQFLSGIALTLELDRNTTLVRGSRGRLEQVLLNLIVNAAEAMGGGGSLRLRVRGVASPSGRVIMHPRESPSYVELTVEDSGPGIAPEILPRIFEPFFTTKHRGVVRGTGLGLSTVHSIAEQDGLGLAVETEPGRGTRFRVFIPVANEVRA
jgi:signal transduction histidine kinase